MNKVYCIIVETKLTPRGSIAKLQESLESAGGAVDVFQSKASIEDRAITRYYAIKNAPEDCTHIFLPDTIDQYDEEELRKCFYSVEDATRLLGSRDGNKPEYGCKVVVRKDIAIAAAESTLKEGSSNMTFANKVEELCKVVRSDVVMYEWSLREVTGRKKKWQS